MIRKTHCRRIRGKFLDPRIATIFFPPSFFRSDLVGGCCSAEVGLAGSLGATVPLPRFFSSSGELKMQLQRNSRETEILFVSSSFSRERKTDRRCFVNFWNRRSRFRRSFRIRENYRLIGISGCSVFPRHAGD